MARALELESGVFVEREHDRLRLVRPARAGAAQIGRDAGKEGRLTGVVRGLQLARERNQHARFLARSLGFGEAQPIADFGQLARLDEQRTARGARAVHDAVDAQMCIGTHGQHEATLALGVVLALQQIREPPEQLPQASLQLALRVTHLAARAG